MSYRDRLPHEIPLPDDDADMNPNAETKEIDNKEQKDFDESGDDKNEDEILDNDYMEELDSGEHSPEFINQLLDEMESKYKIAWSTLSDDQLASGCDCLSHLNYATKLIQFYKSNDICLHVAGDGSNDTPLISSQIKMTAEKKKHMLPFEAGLTILENNRKQKEDLFNRWLRSLKNGQSNC